MTQRPPLRVGDQIRIRSEDTVIDGEVIALVPWEFIAVRTDSGRIYLDICFNISAVSWSRIVLLEQGVDSSNIPSIARAIAWMPKRTDVTDVQGAEALLSNGARLERTDD